MTNDRSVRRALGRAFDAVVSSMTGLVLPAALVILLPLLVSPDPTRAREDALETLRYLGIVAPVLFALVAAVHVVRVRRVAVPAGVDRFDPFQRRRVVLAVPEARAREICLGSVHAMRGVPLRVVEATPDTILARASGGEPRILVELHGIDAATTHVRVANVPPSRRFVLDGGRSLMAVEELARTIVDRARRAGALDAGVRRPPPATSPPPRPASADPRAPRPRGGAAA